MAWLKQKHTAWPGAGGPGTSCQACRAKEEPFVVILPPAEEGPLSGHSPFRPFSPDAWVSSPRHLDLAPNYLWGLNSEPFKKISTYEKMNVEPPELCASWLKRTVLPMSSLRRKFKKKEIKPESDQVSRSELSNRVTTSPGWLTGTWNVAWDVL